jgi:Fe2+ transport system protein FeoA
MIVSVSGSDGIALRLRELGLVPGERVEFLRRAPLGDPLKLLVQGCRIAVRAAEARRIGVEPESR